MFARLMDLRCHEILENINEVLNWFRFPSDHTLKWDNPSSFPLSILLGLAATLCCGSGQLQIYAPNPEVE